MLRATLLASALPLLAHPAVAATPAAAPPLALRKIADGLDDPLWVTAPPGDRRLFVVEQRGRIRILDHGRLLPKPYGGSGGDPYGNARNLSSLLGKLLRIDVDHGRPYAIPGDNPFVHRAGARPEIWAYGLRNPWRFCFSPDGGTLVIADVGQNLWEEVDVAPAGAAGLDYGWNWLEGRHSFRRRADEVTGTVAPAIEYSHDDGCSVIGGFVYRGSTIPALRGWYLYSDYCSSWLRGFRLEGGRAVAENVWPIRAAGQVTSFGEDARGEIYLTTGNGGVYQVVAAGSPPR